MDNNKQSQQRKILLIEDDNFVCDLYVKVLEKAGYKVVVALDGEKALEFAKNEQYDLILLDIMLPKLTGLEVLKALREEGSKARQTPVHLLTNLGEENIANEAFKMGANGYFLKAKYLPHQLVTEIDKIFEKPEQQ